MSNFLRKVIVLALAQFSNFRRHSLSCKLSGEVRFVSDLAVATFKRVKRQDFFLKFFYKILFSLYLKSPFSFIICWTTVNGGKALILLLLPEAIVELTPVLQNVPNLFGIILKDYEKVGNANGYISLFNMTVHAAAASGSHAGTHPANGTPGQRVIPLLSL